MRPNNWQTHGSREEAVEYKILIMFMVIVFYHESCLHIYWIYVGLWSSEVKFRDEP